MKQICLLLTLCLILVACGAKEEPEFVKIIEIYPPAASNDFMLPEGYAFADDTTASIVRSSDGQIIGGILDMGITEDELELEGHDAPTNKYLMSLGYMCEYISWNRDGYKSVTLYITEEGASEGERWVTSRCLFPKNGKCYDLWFDYGVVVDNEITIIEKAVLGK